MYISKYQTSLMKHAIGWDVLSGPKHKIFNAYRNRYVVHKRTPDYEMWKDLEDKKFAKEYEFQNEMSLFKITTQAIKFLSSTYRTKIIQDKEDIVEGWDDQMIKCEVCGRTINEIVEQDGCVTIQEDMPLVCDRCQKREELEQQTEILRKAMAYDKIKKQLDCQKEIWDDLKEWLQDKSTELGRKCCGEKYFNEIFMISIIINKMQELEKE